MTCGLFPHENLSLGCFLYTMGFVGGRALIIMQWEVLLEALIVELDNKK